MPRRKSQVRRQAAQSARPPVPGGPRVELLLPTAEQPFMRRFVPAEDDVEAALAQSDVIDWRGPPGPRLDSLEPLLDRIVCGEAVAALGRLPDASVDCIITSPPYWNFVDYGLAGQIGAGSYDQYLTDLLRVWEQCERVLRPNGKLCLNTPILPIPKAVLSDQHTRHLKNLNNDLEATLLQNLSLQRFSLYVWIKQTTEKMFGSYPYPPNILEQNTIEFINVFVKPGRPRRRPRAVKEASRLSEAQWLNLTRQVWHLYPEDIRRAQHPAPFPEALPNRLIAMYTFGAVTTETVDFPGDVVLDPFNGVGATCLAAKRLGRRYLGLDLSPHFCLVASERLRRTRRDDRVFLCHPDRPSRRSADEGR